MKTFFLLFFLSSAFLTGCSTDYNYFSKRIAVYKTDNTKKDYALLSVRGDSSIVVLDWTEANVYPFPYSHAQVIRKDHIAGIQKEAQERGIFSIVNVTIGAFLGGGYAFLYLDQSSPPGHISRIITPFIFPDLMFAIGGAALGVVLSDAFRTSQSLTINSQQDRDFLRQVSLYPDKEPDGMQYIK